jgi:hypothetical protein
LRVTGTDHSAALRAEFRGEVACSRTANALILSGVAADCADDRLILTFISASIPDIPHSLTAVSVHALDGRHYRIASGSGDLVVEAASLHVHRDIGRVFYRAIPPRRVPLKKRLFLRLVLWLAGSSAGKRVLSSLRRT